MDFAGNRRNPLKSALRGPEVSEFLNLAAFLNKIHYALATQNRNQISENINNLGICSVPVILVFLHAVISVILAFLHALIPAIKVVFPPPPLPP